FQLMKKIKREDKTFIDQNKIDFVLQCFMIPAERGHAFAQYNIGQCYRYGIPPLLTQDEKKALFWFSRAAEQDEKYSLFELGLLFYTSKTLKDEKKAFQYYKRSADLNNAASQCNLGFFYEH